MASTQPQANRPEYDSNASQERASQEFWHSCALDMEEAAIIGLINRGKDEDKKVKRVYRRTLEVSESRLETLVPKQEKAKRMMRETTFEQPLQRISEPEGHPVSAKEPSMPIATPKVVPFNKIVILVNIKVKDDEEKEETTFTYQEVLYLCHHPNQRPPLFLLSLRTKLVM
ncbi:hypothetical protein L6452_02288 [Arctium lappa]|uniref:Uncharacterized protein n=1 Tax=Arctium lappa TaxID=4217 RepID=A0ACB9FJZ1_ARCLA|nr:hypothetical protein L6452_02288 [Arctium lappa]